MDPDPQDPNQVRQRRSRVALIVIGLVLIVLSTLNLTSAGYGTEVKREFAHRRSYDMIKPQVQRALPRTVFLGLAGVLFLMWSGRVGQSRDEGSETNPDS